MDPYLPETIATERRRDLIAEAARRRLVAIATCCRRSGVARTVGRLRGAWTALATSNDSRCCTTA
ncbi:hypothetical protein E1262_11340 [Jiangella aurantiaca]|uniref:Uncharacterized protein n=1 Tax=Jiangella aurantiaca TaxID=2530373 RepID=A0A4R5ACA1_9ACTN|nr:hypothetical protein [Jiangella aurantiaca]TDD69861.1 hypothetical protein E1262_11340 [Jiangella aurantiaca]